LKIDTFIIKKMRHMLLKGNFFILMVLLASFTTSCGDDRQYVERDLSVTFEIPAGLNTIESHYFRIDDVYLFLDETLANNGLPTGGTYEISGSKALLTSRLSGADYSVIDAISVFAVDKDDRTNRIEMFYNENISIQTFSELKLLTSISNIAPYINDNKVDLEVRIRFRGFIPAPIRADLDFGYIIYKD
jgi:hypothetical protein